MSVSSSACSSLGSDRKVGTLVPHGKAGVFTLYLYKLSVRDLREQAILVTELVVEFARKETTVSHRQPSAIAAQLERENRAEGMRVIGDWPYENQ